LQHNKGEKALKTKRLVSQKEISLWKTSSNLLKEMREKQGNPHPKSKVFYPIKASQYTGQLLSLLVWHS
jgi:ribosomal protein S4